MKVFEKLGKRLEEDEKKYTQSLLGENTYIIFWFCQLSSSSWLSPGSTVLKGDDFLTSARRYVF